MPCRAIASFEVTSWDQSTYDTPEDAPPLARATVRKVFRGEVEGVSTAELLMCRPDDSSGGYIASERIVGRVGERAGSFVVQHAATQEGDTFDIYGRVLPGSGTGDLAGIRGICTFRHDQNGAVFTLDYELPKAG
jgi:hypothetical protein